MNTLYNFVVYRLLVVVALSMAVASCNKNDVGLTTIPDMKTIECNAGDRPSFTFSVGNDWQLTSDAVWCKLITSSGEMNTMYGNAGTHSITLRITDEEIRNEPTTAYISLRVGKQEAIIVTVVRGADQLYMRLYDITNTPITCIKLGYIDYIPFLVEANFRFKAVDYPDWVEFYGGELSGVPGEQTESMARIVTNGVRERYPITEADGYTVTFVDPFDQSVFSFPIVFDGMGNDEIVVERPVPTFYGWTVSADGKHFEYSDDKGEVQYFEEGLTFGISALRDDFEVIMFESIDEENAESYYEDGASWIHFDKSSMMLTVDSASVEREGLVIALPRGIYNKVRGNLISNIFKADSDTGFYTNAVRDDYHQYILLEFDQLGSAQE